MIPFAPQPPRINCQEFNNDLYVTRPALEREIREWLEQPQPQHRICSLVGPPGTGKSWVLAHMRDGNDPSCGRLYLDARDLINGEVRNQVKLNLIRTANRCCPTLKYPDTLPTLGAVIERVKEHMKRECATNYVLLMVDGCDDFETPEEFDRIQAVLAKFFGEDTNCFRMLIARRSRLTHHDLRKRDRPVQVGVFRAQTGPDSPEDQKRKLLQLAGKEPDIIDLNSILPEGHYYQWNHPFINCFLLTRQINRMPLTSNALRICCLSLANRPLAPLGEPERYPELDDAALDLLIELAAHLPEQWNEDDFEAIAQRKLHTRDLQRGTIVNIRDRNNKSIPLYSIADGLRELLKDIARMQNMEVGL